MIIQTVVQNALRRLRNNRSHGGSTLGSPSSEGYRRAQAEQDDQAHWSRQDSLPWVIGFAVALAVVAAAVIAFN